VQGKNHPRTSGIQKRKLIGTAAEGKRSLREGMRLRHTGMKIKAQRHTALWDGQEKMLQRRGGIDPRKTG